MKSTYLAAVSAILPIAFIANQAFSQEAPLSCQDLTVTVSNAGSDFGLSFNLAAADIVKQCKSTTGRPITLVAPKTPMTFSANTRSAASVPFEVKDDLGNTAKAFIKIKKL